MDQGHAGLPAKAGFCLAGILFGLGIAEVSIRVIHPQDLQPPFIESFGILNAKPPYTSIHHRHLDFDVVYVTNRYGFRGRDYPFKKPRRTYRILTLGDSFTWGSGIPEDATYSALLEESLNQWAKIPTARPSGIDRFEVINLGLQGVELNVNEYVYRKIGRWFRPDLVILCFIRTNSDLERKVVFADKDTIQKTRRLRAAVRWIPGYNFLCMHSHLVAFLRLYGSGILIHKNTGQRFRDLGLKTQGQRTAYQQEQAGLILDALVKEVCSDAPHLVITSIDDHLDRYPILLGHVRELAKKNRCLSVAKFAIGPGGAFPHDWHWSPAGHRLVADRLFEFLSSQGLLKR